jgi:hypothetical protein
MESRFTQHQLRLAQLREEANACTTLYDKTQLDYSYMEYVLDHLEDVSPFRDEIRGFQKLCLIYVTLYEEAIYGQFLRLLNTLTERLP